MEDKLEKGKILVDKYNNKYFIYNILKVDNIDYVVCINIKNTKEIVVFKYRIKNNMLEISKVENGIEKILLKAIED